MKFKAGDRVRILDKTCGPINGLKDVLTLTYRDRSDLIPRFGTVVDFEENHYKYYAFYRVTPDNYKSNVFRHKNLMFYEEDLEKINNDWFEDELFVI